MTLYELTNEYANLQDALTDPDYEPEVIEEMLADLSEDIEAKAEGYAMIIRNMQADADGYKAEIERLTARKQTAEAGVKRLKTALLGAMTLTGKRDIKTKLFSLKIAKNGGKKPLVIDADASELPHDMVMTEIKPDAEKIRALLDESGMDNCGFAHYEERGEHLNIR